MSRKCPCTRNCVMQTPSRSIQTGSFMPPPDRIRSLADVVGLLVDSAAEYDDITLDDEMTTATEFVWWLQREIGGRGDNSHQVSGTVLRMHDIPVLRSEPLK